MHQHADFDGRHGALTVGSNHVRFSLWAPDAQTVSVVTSKGLSMSMLSHSDGWFSLETQCAVGTHYKYLVDNEFEVPDPASRFRSEDVQGYSVVVDQDAYNWRCRNWKGRPWTEAIIYELHVGLMGGYSAVKSSLPRLADLGVTAIELMPVAQFPGERNWGYDGVLPYAPQCSYGRPEELKSLIDAAHGLGMAVILDVVYNHFGPDGNFLHTYAKQFFQSDKKTPWGDAIDYSRPEVRNFFIDSALMWLLDYRFDGLRLDAVHAIDDPTFLEEFSQRVKAGCGEDREIWLVLENEHNEARRLENGFNAQWNDDGHNTLHVLLTGETDAYYADFAGASTHKLARMLSEGFVYQGEVTRNGQQRGESSGHLTPDSFVLFLQNHDQIGNRAMGERLAHICHPPALRAATALLLLSPMIPLIFMGDEWAADEPFMFFTDFHDELAAKVCEGRRGEFADFAAFADEQQRERVPDPNALSTFETSKPAFNDAYQEIGESTHSVWLSFYRQLLQIRHNDIIPRLHGCKAIGAEVLADKAVTARWLMGDDKILRIDLNLSHVSLGIEVDPTALLLFSSFPKDEIQHRFLPPFTALVTLEQAA
ncbi:malto-oligosyltrehalose trehalohydrolase [Pseudomonas yamanorum]|uniref:malto-oligosyltrehalose trehalohydrolase n=1 Tax=Pseudomonas yamanorum TaxID=515393 RepID=UPI003D367E02